MNTDLASFGATGGNHMFAFLVRVKMGENDKRQISKNEKTKTVVWGAIRTAMKPEKGYEQLRSRSIDWRGQMVHRTKIKIGKKVPGSQMDQKLTLGFSRVLLQKHDF